MTGQRVIVIGASAGGVEAMKKLVGQLPADLPAAVFVVIHLSSMTPSYLPGILTHAGHMPAIHPPHSAAIEPGRIYIAPPDRHLVIERDHLRLSSGAQEQYPRPAINVTFRSASLAYRDDVVGVLLTGERDDGVAGLWEIKRRGGIAVVQNPEDAMFPSMPLSALREIEADYTVRLDDIGLLLARLARGEGQQQRTKMQCAATESKFMGLNCPDCGGAIWEPHCGSVSEFRCRMGHPFSARAMLAEHFATQERALYGAVAALTEGVSFANCVADQSDADTAAELREEAKEREAQAKDVLRILNERRGSSPE